LRIMNPFKRAAEKIREINKRYSKPRIRLSRWTRIALLALRLYLIILVILLAYKFFTILG
jgi:hypothetical protein